MLLAISGGYVLFYFLSIHYPQKKFCVFKTITGYPCPGCGMGRASLELVNGHFFHSLLLNPLAIPFTVLIIVSVVWILFDLVTGKTGFYRVIRKNIPLFAKIIIAILIVCVWIWNIYKGI